MTKLCTRAYAHACGLAPGRCPVRHAAKPRSYTVFKVFKGIPAVDIHSELRSVLCNSKVKIQPYNVTYKDGQLQIDLPNNIKGSLANLIIVKTLTTVGLRYKCVSCKLELDNITKTICFHY